MLQRIIFAAALAIAVLLVPRVSRLVDTVRAVFPLAEGESWLVHLDPALWYTGVFISAHACVLWFGVRIRNGHGTLPMKLLTLILLIEVIAVYGLTLRFRYGGIHVNYY